MSKIRSYLLSSFIEKYSTLAISILSTAILARLLTPAETGLYSVVWGMVDMAHALREFGIGTYILQHEDLSRRRLSGIIGFSLTSGIVLAATFALASPLLAVFFGEPRVQQVSLVMSANFVLVAYANIGLARLQREMNFKAIMRINIAAALAHTATSIVMAWQGFGAVGMATASVVGVLVSLFGGWLYHRGDFFIAPSFQEGRRIFSFGLFASGGALLQAVGARIPDIVIGRFLGMVPVGLYSRGNSLVTLFEQTLMAVINPVAMGALAMCKRQDEDLSAPYLRYLSYATVLAWPCLGGMALLALPIIYLAFGDQWLPAVPLARILCLAAAFAVLSATGTTLIYATGAMRRLLRVQLIAVPLQVAALVIGSRAGVAGVAWGFVGASLLLAIFFLYEVERSLAIGWQPILRVLWNNALMTLGTLVLPGGIVLWQGLSTHSFLAATVAAVLSGGASWLAILFALGHPLRSEILSLVEKFGIRAV